VTKETKTELRERIEELEWEHRVLAKQGLADEQTKAKLAREIEQLKGQQTLAGMQHREELEEIAAAARRSQAAYESLTTERGNREPTPISGVLSEAVESSVRIRLEALDAIEHVLHNRSIQQGGETLVEQLQRIIRERSEASAELSKLRRTHSTLAATVQSTYELFHGSVQLHNDITVQRMAEHVHEYVERAVAGTLPSELVQIIRAVHDRVVGEDASKLTPQEQLVEIGDSAALTRRRLDEVIGVRDRMSQQIARMQDDQQRFIDLAKEIDA